MSSAEPSKIDPDRWGFTGHAYSAVVPPIARFCQNLFERNWFGANLRGAEALTFTQLLFTIYIVQRQGLLLSMKDAMRVIGAEHVTTAKRYADIAVQLGIVKLVQSELDGRLKLLVPTEEGLQLIEKELGIVEEMIHWAEASVSEDFAHKAHFAVREAVQPPRLKLAEEHAPSYDFTSSITVEPPKLEELAVVSEQLRRRGPREGTFSRYIAAYGETLRLMPDNVHALKERAEVYERIGNYEKALEDINRLLELRPDEYLGMRAEVYFEMRQYDRVIEDISRLMELKPELAPRALRARVYAHKGEWRLALEDYDAAVREDEGIFKDPVLPELRAGRGFAHAALGNLEDALADLEEAYRRATRFAVGHTDLVQKSSPDLAEALQQADPGFDNYGAQIKAAIDQVKEAMESGSRKGKGGRAKSKAAGG